MEKSNSSSADEEDNFCEQPNFELNIFDGPPPKRAKRFANLSELELNQLVKQRHSEKTKKSTNWSVATFRGK